MKKKFDLKLTLSLVSLFLSIVFIILGKFNSVCLGIGLIILGIAVAVFGLFLNEKYKAENQEASELLEEELDPKEEKQLRKAIKKQNASSIRKQFCFYIFALALIILGFMTMV